MQLDSFFLIMNFNVATFLQGNIGWFRIDATHVCTVAGEVKRMDLFGCGGVVLQKIKTKVEREIFKIMTHFYIYMCGKKRIF
jgi:hypothetical protein